MINFIINICYKDVKIICFLNSYCWKYSWFIITFKRYQNETKYAHFTLKPLQWHSGRGCTWCGRSCVQIPNAVKTFIETVPSPTAQQHVYMTGSSGMSLKMDDCVTVSLACSLFDGLKLLLYIGDRYIWVKFFRKGCKPIIRKPTKINSIP